MATTDEELREILQQIRTIAVVGIKDDPRQDACRVPGYLAEQGYRILGVNPKLTEIDGKPVFASLDELADAAPLDAGIDLVNLFRAAEHIPAHVDEILRLDPLPRAVWMQLGIHNGEAAARLRAAGIAVVQDHCIMVDHRRLVANLQE